MSSLYKQRICERIIISKAFHLYDNKSYQQMSKIVDCKHSGTLVFNLQPHKKKCSAIAKHFFLLFCFSCGLPYLSDPLLLTLEKCILKFISNGDMIICEKDNIRGDYASSAPDNQASIIKLQSQMQILFLSRPIILP